MPATKTASATRATLDAYYIARAERTGVAVPALFHISFNIAGRTVSDKVRGINGAYARLDLLSL